jgi:cellulose synthase (UDP-forming)
MASTAWSSFGLLFLLAYPFDSKLLSPLILIAALPYFMAMASDLHNCGYKRTDIFRIYGFNLILLPVNLAGVVKSIQQAITGKKIPFARTPKVSDRTATPALFALAPFLIIGYSVWTLWRDIHVHNWGNAAFAGANAIAATYAVFAFMGLGNALVDIWLGFIEKLYVTEKDPTEQISVRGRRLAAPAPAKPSWQDVLYRGSAATASGTHETDGAGQFKILAVAPQAPPVHNRRESDRIPSTYNRRSSDRRPSDRRGDRSSDRSTDWNRAEGDQPIDSGGRS